MCLNKETSIIKSAANDQCRWSVIVNIILFLRIKIEFQLIFAFEFPSWCLNVNECLHIQLGVEGPVTQFLKNRHWYDVTDIYVVSIRWRNANSLRHRGVNSKGASIYGEKIHSPFCVRFIGIGFSILGIYILCSHFFDRFYCRDCWWFVNRRERKTHRKIQVLNRLSIKWNKNQWQKHHQQQQQFV